MNVPDSHIVDVVLARHEQDRDGGYAAVADLRETLSQLDTATERAAALGRLLQLVLTKDQCWRGVALETLVQEGAIESAQPIHSALASITDDNWKKELVRALMRLGHTANKDELRQYVVTRLQAHAGGDLTLIAAFANVDPDGSAELAARFWGEMHAEGKADQYLAYLPSLLINYSKTRPELIGAVMRLVGRTGAPGLEKLTGAVKTYLAKPWAEKQLGQDSWERMRRELARTDTSTN